MNICKRGIQMTPLQERRKKVEERYAVWERMTIHDRFFRQAEKYADREYIFSETRSWTYAEVKTLSKKFGAGLLTIGLKPREHVAINFPNYAEFIISRYGINAASGVAIPLNYRLRKDEFQYIINQSDSSYLVTVDKWQNTDYISMFRELFPEVFQGGKSAAFPHLRKIIVYSPEGKKYEGTIDFYDLVDMCKEEEIEPLLSSVSEFCKYPDDVTDIMYTSGTTSLPKGVMTTHDMLWRSALGSCINRGFQEGRRVFIPIPLYHTFGFIEGVLASTLVGGSFILQVNFDAREALELMEKCKADDIVCVPTIGIKLVEEYRRQPVQLQLNAMYCAGAEAPLWMWKALREELGATELITGYGMTECAAGVLQTDPQDEVEKIVQYVGRVIPGGSAGLPELGGRPIEFRVKDIDTGEYLGTGQEGELVIRGPIVTKGYYNKPDETMNTIDKDGWLKTGDLGVINENGYISLTGRSKDIYRIGAENVSPKEIEDVLTTHPKVFQAYVVGVPDPVMGEVGMAWIVPQPDCDLKEQEVLDYALEKLARFKVPKYIKIIKDHELPVNGTGKVQKFRIKNWFMEQKDSLKALI
jgi:fatty-acyl-CoA synthase